jgi:metal-responsive CopG/Arc/MetJ family transcriptional regulator
MKTAISIPDDLFQAAEAAAKRLGISRSRLYCRAVESYLKRHGARAVTDALNEVYSGSDTVSGLDPMLARMQSASIGEEDW